MGYTEILEWFVEKHPAVPVVHECSLCHSPVVVMMFRIPTNSGKTGLVYLSGIPASCPVCQAGVLRCDNDTVTLDEKEVKNYI